MNFNKIFLGGHLVRDPQLSYTQKQTALANFDIAVNHRRGEQNDVCFVHCAAFGNVAENIVKYFTKGKPIFVTGRLHQNNWQAEDGSQRSRLQVIVDEFRFVGSPEKVRQTNSNQQVILDRQSANNEDDVFK